MHHDRHEREHRHEHDDRMGRTPGATSRPAGRSQDPDHGGDCSGGSGRDELFRARRVYTVEEAAEILRIKRTLMYQLLAGGRVRSLKVGARRLVPAEAIEAFIRAGLEAAGDGEDGW